ncbi:MAG: multicopper oxidase family protein [Frankiaceae bacterium]
MLVGDPPQSATYPNHQRATLLWYHDHATGATRLNVFAGLAGGYVIRDAFDTGGPKQASDPNPWMPFGYGIGAGKYEIPIVIQDRRFNTANGDFLYPTMPPGAGTTGECGDGANVGGYPTSEWPNTTGPWIGEYFGDEMLVNGVCSPVLDVEPAIYRLRILNGCNARFLNLKFQNVGPGVAPPPKLTQIGAEQGLFKTPVTLKSLPMVNAERADVIVDFRKFAGQKLLLRNANMPKPYATPAPRLQDIMKFRVSLPSTQATNAPLAAVPTGTIDGGEAAGTGLGGIRVAHSRQIVLQEWNAGLPGWHLTLSPYSVNKLMLPAVAPITTPDQAACFHISRSDILLKGFVPEEPRSGTVEEWEFYNYTPDTHPMHMHLTRFQLVDRRPIGTAAGAVGTLGPEPWEQGWKDTVAAHPGMVTRIRQKFDLPARVTPGTRDATYVYHCHIVEHEDNDMMRPFIVVA